jgi:hypothetical protein
MVRLLVAVVAMTAACGGGGPIYNLSLSWKGVDRVAMPSASTAAAFAAVPLGFALRDVRPDPSVVGFQEDDGIVVRTRDHVAQYCSDRFADMLRSAGARLDEPPMAALHADLLEYRVDEGGTFKGLVRIQVTVRRAGSADWTTTYEGKSARWGRTHNPANFNEALSNALAEVFEHLVHDEDLSRALLSAPAPGPPGG